MTARSRRWSAVAATWLVASCGSDRPEAAPSAARPRPRAVEALAARALPAPPLVVVGLDGADWQMLDHLVESGQMPELSRLRAEGTSGVLASEHPPLSPILWTTMATGVSPLVHQILDFSRFRPSDGVREPIGSTDRRAPAIWSVASWAGKRTAVLGLWATFPAEPIDGVIVSDRLFSFLQVEAAPPAGAVFPPEREPWARAARERVERAVDLTALTAYLPGLARDEYERRIATSDPYGDPIAALRRVLVETRLYAELAATLAREVEPDLLWLYVQGTDSIGHVFAPFAPPRQSTVAAADFERFSKVPEIYFGEIDRLLGDLARDVQSRGGRLAIVSDHGFAWSEGRPERLSSVDNATAAKWHRSAGVYLFWGAGIPSGRGAPAGLRRVATTLAALLGLPPGTAWAGPPIPPAAYPPGTEPFDYDALFARLAAPTSAGDSAPVAPTATEEEMAKLRSLGYLGANEPARGPISPSDGGSTRTGGSYNNEGLIRKSEGDRQGAVAAFERALALDPRLPSAAWNLSDLLYEMGERERSDDLLVRALDSGLVDGVEKVIGRALADQRRGEIARAAELVGRALATRSEAVPLWVFRGRFRVDLGECAAARGDFARALALAPDDASIHAAAAVAALCAGEPAAALTLLRRAVALSPDDPKLARFLADLEHGSGSR